MSKLTTLLTLTALSLSSAQAAKLTTEIDPKLQITVPNCQKQANDVVCSGTVVAKGEDIHTMGGKVGFTLISPAGDEVQADEYTVKGNDGLNGFDYRQDISYPVSIHFKNYSSSSIKYLDIQGYYGSHRIENVPLISPRTNVVGNNIIAKSSLITNLGKYSIYFSNCQTNSGGTIICTANLSASH